MAASAASFAEQREFAAQVAKEKAAVDWAMRQDQEGRREPTTKRRVRQRRTRDGQEIFAVTFFDGYKPKTTDWLAQDAKREAEFGVEQPDKGSLPYRLGQHLVNGGGPLFGLLAVALKSRALLGRPESITLKGLSKSRSEPCFGSKREGKEKYSKLPFQVVLPLPPKGVDMRGETARDQASLFKPRQETVPLPATEKWGLRKFGLDVDAVTWPDGTQPPPWVVAVGNTTNKWANREMPIRAAREEQEFAEYMLASSVSSRALPVMARVQSTATLLPWVKELPPVRDGRKQFASGKIIPFLNQHVYPEGGVAEVKRARRQEKEAFLRTVADPLVMTGGGRASDVAGSGAGGRGMRYTNSGVAKEEGYAVRSHEAHHVVGDEINALVREVGPEDRETAAGGTGNNPGERRNGGSGKAKTARVAVVKAGTTTTPSSVAGNRQQSSCLVTGRPTAMDGVAVPGNGQQRRRCEGEGPRDTILWEHEGGGGVGGRERGEAGDSVSMFSTDRFVTDGEGEGEVEVRAPKGGRGEPNTLAAAQAEKNRASPVVTASVSVSVVDIGAIPSGGSPA